MLNINGLDNAQVIIERRPNNEYINKKEPITIINNVAILSEIPNEFYKVSIPDMYEIDSKFHNTGVINENQYLVNYNLGIVIFNECMDAKSVIATYQGTGVVLYPASRIYSRRQENFIETLQDVIDDTHKAIDTIGNLDKAIKHGNELFVNINTSINTGKELNETLITSIGTGNDLIIDLNEAIKNANVTKVDLKKVIEDGKATISDLENIRMAAIKSIDDKKNESIDEIDLLTQQRKEDIKTTTDIKKDELNEVIKIADNSKSTLNETIVESENKNTILSKVVNKADELNTVLEDNLSDAKKTKEDLNNANKSANDINTTLNGSIESGTSKIKEIDNKISEVDFELDEIKANEESRQINEENREKIKNEVQTIIENLSICEEWNSSKNYKKLNRATLNGNTYECIKDNVGIEPTNSEYWHCMAVKGKDGEGSGNMHTDDYDKNGNGIVDNAEKVNGFTVECNVPADAKFTDTDTKYDDKELRQAIEQINMILGKSTRHHVKRTIKERDDLKDLNQGDICHVTDTKETFIYDTLDTDGNSIVTEWIKLSDFNSITSVDWSIIKNKPTKLSQFENDIDFIDEEKLKLKADLVNGKVPLEQLPGSSGGKLARPERIVILKENTSIIPIEISEFTHGDTIDVFLNGSKLTKGTQFDISEDGLNIINTSNGELLWETNDEIKIEVYKNMVGEVTKVDESLIDENLMNKINNKADLVNGKIPENQLPDNLGNKQVPIYNTIILDEDRTNIEIGIPKFNADLDDLEIVDFNGRYLNNTEWKLNIDKLSIDNISDTILWQKGDTFTFKVTKNVPSKIPEIDVTLINDGSIPKNKLNPLFLEEVDNKVNKLEGKDLSSNDFTNEYKSKIDEIEANANNYIHPDTHDVEMITGLSKVSKSGDYNDLINKPPKSSINDYERKTYEELKILKENKNLKEGQVYVLTDYRTKYQQPTTNVIKEMEIEELILTASSNNTFEPIVFSSKYPSDTIWYDFDDNICEDKTTPRTGFILRRYDSISGNDCPQDWRSMLWARWTPDKNQYYLDGVLTDYKVWTSGNAIEGVLYKVNNELWMAKNTNIPTSAIDGSVFYKVYYDIDVPLLIKDKTIIAFKIELKKGELQEVKTFGENCINNKINSRYNNNLHNNVFINNCYNNNFGTNCCNNSFGDSCVINNFGNNFVQNLLGFKINYSTFGSGCNNNVFGHACSGNSLGDSCCENTFGSGCNGNIFGYACFRNIFGSGCMYNIIRSACSWNNFGNNCYRSTIKVLNNRDISNISALQKQSGTTYTIEKNSAGSYVYWYINSNNQPVYTQIP